MKAHTRTDAPLLAIPLSSLVMSPNNVRDSKSVDGIEDLAARIEAEGLLQNLVVEVETKDGEETGRYGVVAGGRRLRALQLLKRKRKIGADFEVPCRVVPPADALAASLTENRDRAAMHPVDEFRAFAQLVAGGLPVDDVAARFQVSPVYVQQRLRLANVAPQLLQVYREGGMTLGAVMALAITEDQAAQLAVWKSAPSWARSNPTELRGLLTKAEVPSTDRRARFVGLKAYEKAGGTTRSDLFADENGSVPMYLQDSTLLDQLALAKLQALGERERAKGGFAWVEVSLSDVYKLEHGFSRIERIQRAPSPQEAEALEALRMAECEAEEAVEALYEGAGDDDIDPAALERLEDASTAARERRQAAEDALQVVPEAVADKVGVLVGLSHAGKADVRVGFVRAADVKAVKAMAAAAATGGNAESIAAAAAQASEPRPGSLPATVVRRLSVHRTLALRAALASNVRVALVATVHALLSRVVDRYRYSVDRCALTLSLRDEAISRDLAPDVGDSIAARELAALVAAETADMPEQLGDLFAWLQGQDDARLQRLLALSVAHSVDAVQLEAGSAHSPRSTSIAASRELGAALSLDMRRYWKPTAEAFLSLVPKAVIESALAEVGQGDQAQAWSKLKKGALVESAEPVLVGAEWLPAPLRGAAD